MFNCNKFFNAMVVLIILSSTCYAKDSISGVDGQTLLDACRDKKSIDGQALCTSYIASFKDTVVALKLAYKNAGLEIPPLYCLPEDGVNQEQLMQVVIDFIEIQLKKNPNVAKVNAATLALAALYRKYPCQYE